MILLINTTMRINIGNQGRRQKKKIASQIIIIGILNT